MSAGSESDAAASPVPAEPQLPPWRAALEAFAKASARIELPLPVMERVTHVEGAISYEEAIRQLLAKRNVLEMTDEELALLIDIHSKGDRVAEGECHDG